MPVVVLWSVFAAPVTVATGIALANADAWPERRPGNVPASDTCGWRQRRAPDCPQLARTDGIKAATGPTPVTAIVTMTRHLPVNAERGTSISATKSAHPICNHQKNADLHPR